MSSSDDEGQTHGQHRVKATRSSKVGASLTLNLVISVLRLARHHPPVTICDWGFAPPHSLTLVSSVNYHAKYPRI